MTHVTRWRTITATATTAVLATGAFGISAAVERPAEDAERIELTAEATVAEPVEDGTVTLDRSIQSTASADPTASVSPASASVSPDSEGSADDALSGASSRQGAVTQLQPDGSPSPSPEDSPSPSPEDSPSISAADDSPSPSADDSPSPSAEDSPSLEDSPSVEDDGSPDSSS
ncbi:MAG: hypothetical protein WD638_08770 [Nitriliruptoraceae bacterium]